MNRAVVGMLLVIPLLAGCLQGAEEGTNGEDNNQPEETSPALVLNATSCTAVAVAAMVEPATAYRSLPPGFRPRDSRGLFDTVVDTGKIPIFIAGVDCLGGENDLGNDDYNLGLVGIFIETPSVQGDPSDSEYDFYLSHIYTNNSVLLNAFASLDWSHTIGEANLTLNDEYVEQVNYGGTGIIEDENGTVVSMTALAVATIPAQDDSVGFENMTIKFWHQTDAGVGYLDYLFSSDAPLGPGTCDLRDDTPPADAVGHDRCPLGVKDDIDDGSIISGQEPQISVTGDSTLAAAFRNLDLEGELIWMPGKVAS